MADSSSAMADISSAMVDSWSHSLHVRRFRVLEQAVSTRRSVPKASLIDEYAVTSFVDIKGYTMFCQDIVAKYGKDSPEVCVHACPGAAARGGGGAGDFADTLFGRKIVAKHEARTGPRSNPATAQPSHSTQPCTA